MEAVCSSETSVASQRTTRRYIPEDSTLHNHRCENLKSYIALGVFFCKSHCYTHFYGRMLLFSLDLHYG
jgi:hypothetical protein